MTQEYREARFEFERGYFSELMTRHKNCVLAVAREAGLNRTELYRKLESLGLRRSTHTRALQTALRPIIHSKETA